MRHLETRHQLARIRSYLLVSASMLMCGTAWQTAQAAAPAWMGFANNAQHTGVVTYPAQPLNHIHWKFQIDTPVAFQFGVLNVHFMSPVITATNSVIIPSSNSKTGGFHVNAIAGASGMALWTEHTDYVAPPTTTGVIPTPLPLPITLTLQNELAYAGAGGTIIVRGTPDSNTGTHRRIAFYGNQQWQANQAAYNAAVTIMTPITADQAGNLYFGFIVNGSTPANLVSGFARIDSQGHGSWVSSAIAAQDATMTSPAIDAAPAVSNDGKTVYVVVSNGSTGQLVALDSTTLATKAHVALIDPETLLPAWLYGGSSASPTIAPDGDVYYGVLENPFPEHDARGWLLHFDSTLATAKTPGSFGWDTTAALLPATAVPRYHGTSSYLIALKYNNYDQAGPRGTGDNKLAVIDPASTQKDPYSKVQVMREVQTVLSPHVVPNGTANARYEWCINAMVADAAGTGIISTNADGNAYHWNLKTNTLDSTLTLNVPTPEPYTPTATGPDGTVYLINHGFLYAVGQ